MNAVATAQKPTDGAREHRGDLYRDQEDWSDLVARVREHLRVAFPDMEARVRIVPIQLASYVNVSITRCDTADLTDRDTGFAARRRITVELERFTRHDWAPHRGAYNESMGFYVSIDPALRAAALNDVPEVKPLVSFAQFTRTARPGDVLEHLAGKETHQGKRVVITAISSRRLTTRPADPGSDGRESRVPIQGGACFVSDGDLVCFKHSGFADQGGYSLLRWIRQP